MDERTTRFVDLILPVPIRKLFTYRVPFALNDAVLIGQRVIVPFGKKKRITGIVAKIHEEAPSEYTAKFLDYILDEQPIITLQQLEFWHWISSYYLAPIGDVMHVALPSNFKLASETVLILHPDFDGNMQDASPKEALILQILAEREKIELNELAEITETNNVALVIKKMIEKGMIITQEEINQRYTPKTKTYLRLHPDQTDVSLAALLDELERSNRTQGQFSALLRFIQLTKESPLPEAYVEKKVLLSYDVSISSLIRWRKRG